jgi:hypothetical protein
MISRQLDLGFESQSGLKPAARSQGRSNRANWWFERMRGVVTQARDWPPASPPAEAPRPPAAGASSGPPPSAAAPQASSSVLPDTGANAPSASEPRRWNFRRTRRLIWE